MRLLRNIILLAISLAIFSCSNDDNEPTEIDQGYDFYPVEIGHEWIYDAQLIEYQISSDDTTTFQIREVVDTTYTIGEETGFTLKRYSRPDNNSSWSLDSIWTMQKNNDGVIRRENNYRYQKIEFPALVGENWDGNKWNIFDEDNYEITTIDSSLTIGNNDYTEVMKVDEGTSINLIEEKEQFTLYSRNIGPIQIVNKNLETQPGEKTIGTIRTYSLNSYNF